MTDILHRLRDESDHYVSGWAREAMRDAACVIEQLRSEIEGLKESRDRWEARCLGALWLVPDEKTCGELQEAAHRAKALLGNRT